MNVGQESHAGLAAQPLGPASRARERLCQVYSLGCVPYREAWQWQRKLVEQRKLGQVPDTLLLLEHPPVITLGRNARPEHLLTPPDVLRENGVEVVETDRGGDVTFHGPGQLMGYPILDLGRLRKDVVWYVRTLEEALIRTATDFGLPAGRIPGLTGVWVHRAKLAAIGIHLSRWITSHGFAVNLNTNLGFFTHIVPCGIHGVSVTSFRELLGQPVDRRLVEERIAHHLGERFDLRMRAALPKTWEGGRYAD